MLARSVVHLHGRKCCKMSEMSVDVRRRVSAIMLLAVLDEFSTLILTRTPASFVINYGRLSPVQVQCWLT